MARPKKDKPIKETKTSKKKTSKKEIDDEDINELSDVMSDYSDNVNEMGAVEDADEIDDDQNEDDENKEDEDDENKGTKDDIEEDDVEEEEIEEYDEDNECLYKFANKKKYIRNNDEKMIIGYDFDDDTQIVETNVFIEPNKRTTKPWMTKYERVRVLAERSKQISLGAKPMVKNVLNMNPKEIAKTELEMKVLPFFIIRKLPSGKKEKWDVNELSIEN